MKGAALLGLALGLRLVGVVDQIDGGWAWVEWEGRAFGHVQSHLLPPSVGEGDVVVLRLRRRGALVHLPRELAPPDGPEVRASLHRGRARPRSSRP